MQVLALDLQYTSYTTLPKSLVYPEVKFLLLQKALSKIEWLMYVKSLANNDVPWTYQIADDEDAAAAYCNITYVP